jgi:hypothetical protein
MINICRNALRLPSSDWPWREVGLFLARFPCTHSQTSIKPGSPSVRLIVLLHIQKIVS